MILVDVGTNREHQSGILYDFGDAVSDNVRAEDVGIAWLYANVDTIEIEGAANAVLDQYVETYMTQAGDGGVYVGLDLTSRRIPEEIGIVQPWVTHDVQGSPHWPRNLQLRLGVA